MALKKKFGSFLKLGKILKKIKELKDFFKAVKAFKKKIKNGSVSADGAKLTQKDCKKLLRFIEKVDDIL